MNQNPIHQNLEALASMNNANDRSPHFSALIIGDEILSGRRADKHLSKVIALLNTRGLQLSHAEYIGDSPAQITQALQRALAGSDVVFSFGGIGATPDDHTRQCAAQALGRNLVLHPEAAALIYERMQDTAREQGIPYEPEHPTQVHRLNMGKFPEGANIIPNPYNKIPGFSVTGKQGAQVYFVPGFPVMAWPMVEWVLDTYYHRWFEKTVQVEKSVIVFGSFEAVLTPLMLDLEQQYPRIKVFSLPSVDDPKYGRHIDLGIKGLAADVAQAYPALLAGLHQLKMKLGPEMQR